MTFWLLIAVAWLTSSIALGLVIGKVLAACELAEETKQGRR